ncbi:hypothetical protein AWZ03_011358 [Drosophila navojoa]|uniref:Uncharacterized protein n=1 Tax=Drosophila navojoa TaxID=7232 RepID=A0A484B2A5_DRONA|nr:uncharacterized protein LOC108654130 [Drosophila navojoa]TDG42220.1 hypothetical protein AWZ03_011358 [Drosophila navojoa]
MSTDDDSSGRTSACSRQNGVQQSTEAKQVEPRRSSRNTSNLLHHQHSFEARYSNIIQKQIWENTINKDAIKRQLNDYFPFARTASLTRKESDCSYDLLSLTPGSNDKALKARSLGSTPTKHRSEDSLESFDSAKKQAKYKGDAC